MVLAQKQTAPRRERWNMTRIFIHAFDKKRTIKSLHIKSKCCVLQNLWEVVYVHMYVYMYGVHVCIYANILCMSKCTSEISLHFLHNNGNFILNP